MRCRKCEYSHWSIGCLLQLSLTDASNTNLWDFLVIFHGFHTIEKKVSNLLSWDWSVVTQTANCTLLEQLKFEPMLISEDRSCRLCGGNVAPWCQCKHGHKRMDPFAFSSCYRYAHLTFLHKKIIFHWKLLSPRLN